MDTGGTFTDCVVLTGDGEIAPGKALSTYGDLSTGVLDAIENASAELGLSAGDVLADTAVFCHATTAGLNELYTRSGARVALVTTRGHEDAMRIGRVFLKASGVADVDVTDTARLEKPEPLVDPQLVFGVAERVDLNGDVVFPLADAEIERVADAVAASAPDAVAIALLWSFRNPAHERALQEALRARLPEAFVSISSDVAPVMGEYERVMTTVVNAYVGPTLRAYLDVLRGRLGERGLVSDPLMMQSNGGVFPLSGAGRRSVNVLQSGPAGGVIGSAALGAELGHPNVVTTDVGGTSFDVSLVVGGEPMLCAEPELDRFSVYAPMIDVRSIGAGGGSIAGVDPEYEMLRVGPKSAGSNPGPACYGRGGDRPTVTDANLVLGRLDPDSFFGGRMRLDVAAAERAIERDVAGPLGMTLLEAATGIVDIADNLMADLVRRMTTERGYDASEFVIYAFGGGGPVHVGAYGATIGARSALIPAHAPVFSAHGIAGADAKHFARRSAPGVMPFDAATANTIFDELSREGAETLGASRDLRHECFVSMRFRNQTHEVAVPIAQLPLAQEEVAPLADRFLELYEQRYGAGTALPGMVIESVTYEVVTVARLAAPQRAGVLAGAGGRQDALKATRAVAFAGAFHDTPVYDGGLMSPGDTIEGPALVDRPATTIVVHPGQSLVVDDHGNFSLSFVTTTGGAA